MLKIMRARELGSFPFVLPPPPVDCPPTLHPPPPQWIIPPVEVVATATSVFTEYIFRRLVDSAHNSQISSTFQEADCLLKPIEVNNQVVPITLLNRNLNHTAQLSIS